METISYIVLILLSLVGYSAGTVAKAGKDVEVKPQFLDLIVVTFIWAGAIYSRTAFDLSKWLLILLWVVASSIIGAIAIWSRKLVGKATATSEARQESPVPFIKRLWRNWKNFSRRMGSFQSRIIFSFFFFFVVTPFALGVKLFSDPLNIKNRNRKSHWLSRKQPGNSEDAYRRQF